MAPWGVPQHQVRHCTCIPAAYATYSIVPETEELVPGPEDPAPSADAAASPAASPAAGPRADCFATTNGEMLA